MDLWWLLPSGFIAFFVFAYIIGLTKTKETYVKKLPPTSPNYTSSDYKTKIERLNQNMLNEVLGNDHVAVLGDFGDLLVRMHEEEAEETNKQYPLMLYPIGLLRHDKAQIAGMLDYLMLYGHAFMDVDMFRVARLNLDRFTDDEELLKKQQEVVETLKKDGQGV
tara:strand:- start:814 stop:1305 length:492 start_codon:yes stop_codon:yes gene_type:complete